MPWASWHYWLGRLLGHLSLAQVQAITRRRSLSEDNRQLRAELKEAHTDIASTVAVVHIRAPSTLEKDSAALNATMKDDHE